MLRRASCRGARRSLRGRSARTCMRLTLLPAFCVCFVHPSLSSVATIGHTADAVTLSVCSRFSEVTLGEVLGNNPPRAFRNMGTAEREQLFWDLKAQTTAQRGQDLLRQQAPPVRFGPNRGQTEQPRQGRRARVLSAEQRRERLAQEGQSSMDIGGGEVSKPLFCPRSPNRFVFRRHTYSHLRAVHLRPRSRRIPRHPRLRRLHSLPPHGLASRHQPHRSRLLQCRRRPHSRLLPQRSLPSLMSRWSGPRPRLLLHSPHFPLPLHSLIGLLSSPRDLKFTVFLPPLLPSFLLAPSSSPSLPPVRQFGHGSLNTPSDTLSFLPVLTFFLSLPILLLSLHAPRYSPSTPIQVLSRHAHPFSPANV